jgi:FtsX extracellular domain
MDGERAFASSTGGPVPPRPGRRVLVWSVVLLLVAVAGAAGVAIQTAGGDAPQQAAPDDPLTTPDGTVQAFLAAMRRSDCAAVDGFRTDALSAELAADGKSGCAEFAALAGEMSEERLDEVLPTYAVEVRYRVPDVAVVHTTFDLPGDRSDRVTEAYLVRQRDGTWLMATPAEAARRAPDDPTIGTDLIVFVDTSAAEAQRAAIETFLEERSDVLAFVYFDDAATAAEFRALFRDNPEMLDRLAQDPGSIPTSFRVAITGPGDAAATGSLIADLQVLPGVHEVSEI